MIVMTNATTTRIASRDQNGSVATSASAITMISADRMRSVRTAPAIIFFSASGLTSVAGSSGSWWPETRCQIFSAPS